MTTKETTMYEFNFEPTGGYYRRPCHVCRGCTEKHLVGMEATVPRACGGAERLIVCETCVEADNIDERFAQHADRMERGAAFLRSLIGHLQVPSYRQWQDAVQKAEDEQEAAYVECLRRLRTSSTAATISDQPSAGFEKIGPLDLAPFGGGAA
jgi:hypothetical protein